jgi:hypothetical protein
VVGGVDLDTLIDEIEPGFEVDCRVGPVFPHAALDDEVGVLDRKALGEVRVAREQVVGVADAEEGGDDRQVEVFGDAFHALAVVEVALVHVGQAREFGVGEQDVGVAGPGGAGPGFLKLVDVDLDEEVGGVVEPELAVVGTGGEGEQCDDQERPGPKCAGE